jgi:hypothetical protein
MGVPVLSGIAQLIHNAPYKVPSFYPLHFPKKHHMLWFANEKGPNAWGIGPFSNTLFSFINTPVLAYRA